MIGVAENLTNPNGHAFSWQLQGTRHCRLAQFQLLLESFFGELPQQFDAVFYERPFARGQHATRALWGYAGVLEAMATCFQIAIIEATPKEIKKFATGNGKAEKPDMILAAQVMGYDGDNEHEADAFCGLRYAEANAVASGGTL